MPCDTISRFEVRLEGCNVTILKSALEALGYRVIIAAGNSLTATKRASYVAYAGGNVTIRSNTLTEAQLKQEYSRQAVMLAAKRAGARVKHRSPTQMEIEL